MPNVSLDQFKTFRATEQVQLDADATAVASKGDEPSNFVSRFFSFLFRGSEERSKNIATANALVDALKDKYGDTPELREIADRQLWASSSGRPLTGRRIQAVIDEVEQKRQAGLLSQDKTSSVLGQLGDLSQIQDMSILQGSLDKPVLPDAKTLVNDLTRDIDELVSNSSSNVINFIMNHPTLQYPTIESYLNPAHNSTVLPRGDANEYKTLIEEKLKTAVELPVSGQTTLNQLAGGVFLVKGESILATGDKLELCSGQTASTTGFVSIETDKSKWNSANTVFVKPYLGGSMPYGLRDGMLHSLKEVAVSAIDKELGFDLVPPTYLMDAPGKDYNGVTMEKGLYTVSEYRQFSPVRQNHALVKTHVPELERHQAFVLDFLVSAQDRHGNNIGYTTDPTTGAPNHLVLFDNGDSMPAERFGADLRQHMHSCCQIGISHNGATGRLIDDLNDIPNQTVLDAVRDKFTDAFIDRLPVPDTAKDVMKARRDLLLGQPTPSFKQLGEHVANSAVVWDIVGGAVQRGANGEPLYKNVKP